MDFSYSCIMTFSIFWTDRSGIRNSSDFQRTEQLFLLSVSPCTAKQEQYCALLEACFRFPALKEGPHVVIILLKHGNRLISSL